MLSKMYWVAKCPQSAKCSRELSVHQPYKPRNVLSDSGLLCTNMYSREYTCCDPESLSCEVFQNHFARFLCLLQPNKDWYFVTKIVTKIVLTYCEKKLF